MSSDRFSRFAKSVSKDLLDHESAFTPDNKQSEVVHVEGNNDEIFSETFVCKT